MNRKEHMRQFLCSKYMLSGLLSAAIFPLLWLCLGGCSPDMRHALLHDYPPQDKTVILLVDSQTAYQRAYKAFGQMDGKVESSDPTILTMTGEVHYAVRLTVGIERQGGMRSLVKIHGSVMPGKMVVGTFEEVEQYAALLQVSEGR